VRVVAVIFVAVVNVLLFVSRRYQHFYLFADQFASLVTELLLCEAIYEHDIAIHIYGYNANGGIVKKCLKSLTVGSYQNDIS
jgi:hypothetical protein